MKEIGRSIEALQDVIHDLRHAESVASSLRAERDALRDRKPPPEPSSEIIKARYAFERVCRSIGRCPCCGYTSPSGMGHWCSCYMADALWCEVKTADPIIWSDECALGKEAAH